MKINSISDKDILSFNQHKNVKFGKNIKFKYVTHVPDEFVGTSCKDNTKNYTFSFIKALYQKTKKIFDPTERLYRKKVVISDLPEHIDFKEAQTIEEAVRFSKDVLKIKSISPDLSLICLNIINSAIVDVSNKNKGKFFVPTALESDHYKTGAFAAAGIYAEKSSFGTIIVNNDYFEDEGLNKTIASAQFRRINNVVNNLFVDKKLNFSCKYDESLIESMKNSYLDPTTLSIKEKLDVFNFFGSESIAKERIYCLPEATLKKYIKLLKRNGIKVNFGEFEKLSYSEQQEYTYKKMAELNAKGVLIPIIVRQVPLNSIVYHELGHFQDMVVNFKSLNNVSWLNKFKSCFGVRERTNRYMTLFYKKIIDNLAKNKKSFKKHYPDLYSFKYDDDVKRIASSVSMYAACGAGEFVAEVYKGLIMGRKYSQEVLNLYDKLNGPKIPLF